MKSLFERWEAAGIPYSHFKSNTHLDDSFLRKGDFDVLVQSHKLYAAEEIILSLGGKRFNSFYYGRYPGVDNWLLFDSATGDIKHLHLHCQLCSGKSGVKDYVIPWADYILEHTVRDPQFDIAITDPNVEILLLLLRTIIKSKAKDARKARLGTYKPHKDLQEEWDDLHSRVDFGEVDRHIAALFPEEDRAAVSELVRLPRLTSKGYRTMNAIARRYLRPHRRMSGFAAACASLREKYAVKLAWKLKGRKIGHRPIKKTATSCGAIIAFVGVDGSGKSTTTGEIEKWLRHKIDCRRYYMGEGDGDVPLRARLFKKLLRKMKGAGSAPKKSSGGSGSGGSSAPKAAPRPKKSLKNYVGTVLRGTVISDIQKHNYKKIIQMNKYRTEGGISLLDRFPQLECEGKNDGPKIAGVCSLYLDRPVFRRFLRREQKHLGIVKTIKPDIVFRLNITAEESMRRKPEQVDIEEFRGKLRDLESITFQNARIIDIDAAQPYDAELLEIKAAIWKYL